MTIIHTLWFEYGTCDKPNVLDLFTTFMAYLLEIESFLFCQWLKSVKIMLKRLRPSFLICSKFSILGSSQNVGEVVEAQTICWYTPFCWWFLHILLALWLVSAIHFGQKSGLSKVYQAVKGTERASFSQNMALDALLVTPQVARSVARSLKGIEQ